MTTRSLFFIHIDLTELDREQTYNYTIAGIPRSVRYWTVHSRPANPDSDGDGLMDSDQIVNQWGYNIADPHPMTGDVFVDLGSEGYMAEVDQEYIATAGGSPATYPHIPITREEFYVSKVMKDVDRCEFNPMIFDENWDRLCDKFNECVRSIVMREEIHYFRNKLNRAPKTLAEMLHQQDRWDLLSMDLSKYHMFGDVGEYNLKFVSKDGKYEGVYYADPNLSLPITSEMYRMNPGDEIRYDENHFPYIYHAEPPVFAPNSDGTPSWVALRNLLDESGIQPNFDMTLAGKSLDENNDPVNMGTYNYASPSDGGNHALLDVIPYYKWGNVAGVSDNGESRYQQRSPAISNYRWILNDQQLGYVLW